ncbi:MAG TPA: hypothetical protein VFB77_08115 [Acidimicrobiales bacterium]|nr:hypothetical protein [Acidimicrobiales bacterium]
MRPDENDSPEPGADGSLADGRSDVSSAEPFGDDAYDEDVFDDTDSDDTDGDDTYGEDGEDVFEEDGGFGDGSTEPVGEDDGGVLVPGEDTTILETEDTVPADSGDLELEGHENDPLEGVGYLIDELRDALLGEDDPADGLAGPSPFDADPSDVASDTDLDLTGDGVIDGHDLHEAHSVFDFDVSDG